MSVFENFISSITGGDLLGKLIVAIVLVCAIAVVSHVLVKWLRHIMQRDDTSIPQSSIFINIMRGIVWGLGCCFVLDTCFNVNMSALIAALGVGGIALSLGFQDTLSNLIGGVQISFMKIVKPGRQHPGWFKQGSGAGRYVASCNHQEPLGRNGNHPQFGNFEECGSAPAATRARVGSLCCNYV